MSSSWSILRGDPPLREKFYTRAKIISLIRNFFSKENFLEVETPSLVKFPGMEPNLNPIGCRIPGGEKGYLITSPEYAMKKILAAGFPKIFQICKSFRGGEENDRLHNLEFTILEWYRAGADYRDIMLDVENLFIYILQNIFPDTENKIINYRGQKIDLTPPWPRLTMKEAFFRYAELDLDKLLERGQIADAVEKMGYNVSVSDGFDDIFFKIFLSKIEAHLGQKKPTILYDWPIQMAALAREKKNDPRYAERFEVYIGGLELGNAFSELNDSEEQRVRFSEEKRLRKELNKDIYDLDEDFLEALRRMPNSGGIAMGVDRIVMLFTDTEDISEVVFFPSKEIFK